MKLDASLQATSEVVEELAGCELSQLLGCLTCCLYSYNPDIQIANYR